MKESQSVPYRNLMVKLYGIDEQNPGKEADKKRMMTSNTPDFEMRKMNYVAEASIEDEEEGIKN